MSAVLLLGVVAAAFLVGTLPLYIAVKIFGGDVSFLKVLIVKTVAAVIAGVLSVFLNIIGVAIAGIVTLFIYKFIFDLSFLKAMIAWVIEGVVMAGLVILIVVLGVVSIGTLGM